MQLELAFLERPVEPDDGSNGPWDQIDPQAQIAALVLLSRLIAQKLVSKVARESRDPQRSRRLTQVCSFELTQRLQPYGVDHCRRLWRVGAASVVVPFRASRPWAAAALVGT